MAPRSKSIRIEGNSHFTALRDAAEERHQRYVEEMRVASLLGEAPAAPAGRRRRRAWRGWSLAALLGQLRPVDPAERRS